MQHQDWQRVFELFHACLERSPDARASFLAASGAPDPVVAEVRALLATHEDVATRQLGVDLAMSALGAASGQSLPVLAPGSAIGPFETVRHLGSGAFSHVYLARDPSLDRLVVLKATRFANEEAKLMAKLEHPNVVPIYKVEHWPDRDWHIACMPYTPCASLDRVLAHCARVGDFSGKAVLDAVDATLDGAVPLHPDGLEGRAAFRRLAPLDVACRVGDGICRALEYTHDRGILHLDIKPGNVLIDVYGAVRLTDFNVSVHISALHLGKDVRVGGTFAYMAPEHKALFERGGDARRIGPASDVYSLGQVFTEWATAAGFASTRFGALAARCTAEDPAARPANARDVRHRLASAAFLERFHASAPETGPAARWACRHPIAAVQGVLILTNALASCIQILYNKAFIVDRLSEAQQGLFQAAVGPWNAFVFTAAFLALRRAGRPFFRHHARPGDEAGNVAARRGLLRFERAAVAVVLTGWTGGFLLFHVLLHHVGGGLGLATNAHLAVSFLVAALIAVAYSYLPLHLLTVRCLYPALLEGEAQCGETCRDELSARSWLRQAIRYLAGVTPLLGAMVLVAQGDGTRALDEAAYQGLLLSLMVMGIIGFTVATRWLDASEKSLALLLGPSP